jgi:hypothetical protein
VVFISWILSLLAGTLAQVHKMRSLLAWGDQVEFGLEIEIRGNAPMRVLWDSEWGFDGPEIKSDLPLRLPQYSVTSSDQFDAIANALLTDLFNACGSSWSERCTVPWASVLTRK